MKRNMNLVRRILMEVAESPDAWDSGIIDDYAEKDVGYHVQIMIEAGLLSAVNVRSMADDFPKFQACRLTWNGNDFLDAALEDGRWKQAREMIDKVGSAPIQVWTTVLTTLTMNSLGL